MGSGAGGRRRANVGHSLGNPLDRLLPGQWGRPGRAAVKAAKESQLLLLASARIATGSVRRTAQGSPQLEVSRVSQ